MNLPFLASKITPTLLADLHPARRHARTHSAAQINQVAESIRTFGFNLPILIDLGGEIIAGHARVAAARQIGLTEVPCIVLGHLNPEQRRAYALADNRLALEAGWDADLLHAELLDLARAGIDLRLAGFNDDELADVLAELNATATPLLSGDPDDAPPLEPRAVSVPGQIYQLGPHRLACADSRDPVAMADLFGAEQAACVWTDPPYGIAYEGKAGTIINDDLAEDELVTLLRRALALAYQRCRPGAPWYVASPGGPLMVRFGQVLRDLGVWRETLVWVKDAFVLSRQDYHWRHEPILTGQVPEAQDPASEAEQLVYGWVQGRHVWRGGRKQDTVWQIPRPKRSAEHPTMKPVALVHRCLVNSTRAGDLVLDPFAGSGTTLIAAAVAGRTARVIELDPRYCDVIRRRWTRFAAENGADAGEGALA